MSKRYNQIGSIVSNLGLPTGQIVCSVDRADACSQPFENGAMYYSAKTGAYENFGDVSARYIKMGAIKSALGLPNGPIVCSAERADACRQSYENGSIFYSAKTGAWETYGDIFDEYKKLGLIRSKLGLPRGAITNNVQNFEHGRIANEGGRTVVTYS